MHHLVVDLEVADRYQALGSVRREYLKPSSSQKPSSRADLEDIVVD